MSDELLVEAFQSGDKAAGEQLLIRYKSRVLSIARSFFLSGGETEDLVQEGMCGLYSAMVRYDKSSGTSFMTYAHSCIKNRIIDAVRSEKNDKNSALNSSEPLDDGANYSPSFSPEEELLNSEAKSEFLNKLSLVLSNFEYKVIVMYIDGLAISEISSALGRSAKSIDNAIMRTKRKLMKFLKAEE